MYFRAIWISSLAVAAAVGYAAGMRGTQLEAFTAIAGFVFQFVVAFINLRLFPPDVEVTGDVRGILFDVPDEPASADGNIAINQPQSIDPQPPITTLQREWWSLEGIGIILAVSALGLWMLWSLISPAVYRALPELGAIRRGPRGFPVAVHIGQTDLAFTNSSPERWVCDAVLGRQQYTSPTFTVEAGGTNRIPYAGFRDSTNRSGEDDLSAFARDTIRLRCTDESQRTHSLDLD
jgi:hypothetical protein